MKNKVEFEDVRELVNEIVYGIITREHHRDRIDEAINRWLKQFGFTEGIEVKEIAVGLTDEQIIALASVMVESYDTHWGNINKTNISKDIRVWLKTQTFAQSKEYAQHTVDSLTEELKKCHEIIKAQKEVKEVAVGLTAEQIEEIAKRVVTQTVLGLHMGVEPIYQRSIEAVKDYIKTQTFEVREIPVGLTDEQIRSLTEFIYTSSSFTFDSIKSWIGTQTFTLPEVCVKFSDKQLWDLYDDEEVKEIPVGLTDEQVMDLAAWINEKEHHSDSRFKVVTDWLKNQTFAQQPQFAPDWDNAPEWANWVAQSNDGLWRWFEKEPYTNSCCWISDDGQAKAIGMNENWKETLQQRPTPEVGQVWKFANSGRFYVIIAVGDMKGDEDEAVCFPDWVDSVTYQCKESGKVYTRTLTSFLEKFRQVQS